MSEKTIMLVCAAGLSTSLLVSKMQKAAHKNEWNVNVFATSAIEAMKKLDTKKVDILLLGPQVRFMQAQFEEKVSIEETPVDVINMQDYGMVNGEKILESALNLIKK